jgi:hypothetical protein
MLAARTVEMVFRRGPSGKRQNLAAGDYEVLRWWSQACLEKWGKVVNRALLRIGTDAFFLATQVLHPDDHCDKVGCEDTHPEVWDTLEPLQADKAGEILLAAGAAIPDELRALGYGEPAVQHASSSSSLASCSHPNSSRPVELVGPGQPDFVSHEQYDPLPAPPEAVFRSGLAEKSSEGEPGDPMASLRQAAQELRLKGNEAIIVEQLCARGGRMPLADLAPKCEWDNILSAWNPARIRLNKKLRKRGWQLSTHDKHAIAEPFPSARK